MSVPHPLRAVTQRLNLIPVEDLPRHAGFLALSILNCNDVLQAPEGQKGDITLLVHKLKTRVSSLIQDKTSEGRFTGIVLAKAVVDAGGLQTLSSSASWARSLLSCLNKQDPPEVKKLCLITITRIFLSTKDHPSFVREITSPTLPAFITTTIGLIRPLATIKGLSERSVVNPLLNTVLQCWLQLIYHFAPTFRPSISSIRSITLRIICDETVPQTSQSLAADLLAAVHASAPKQTSSTEWSQTCHQIIEATHQAANQALRSVIEEWTSATTQQVSSSHRIVSSTAAAAEVDALGMEAWTGIHAGVSRMVQLMRLLKAMLNSKHLQPTNIPIAHILDLTARFAALIAPSTQYSLRPNQDIGRDEREELWIELPRLHLCVLEILGALTQIFGQILRPVAQVMLSQARDVFEAAPKDAKIRTASYNTLRTLLQERVVELVPSDLPLFTAIIKACCRDLKSNMSERLAQSESHGDAKSSKTVDMVVSQPKLADAGGPSSRQDGDLYQAAWGLIPVLFGETIHILSSSIRAELDSTAILVGHKEAMLASVLNPTPPRKGAKLTPSILPFLARADGQTLAFEALVRPRMPVIQAIPSNDQAVPETEISADDAESDNDQSVANMIDGHDSENTELVQLDNEALQQIPETTSLSRKRELSPSGIRAVDEVEVESSKKLRTEYQTMQHVGFAGQQSVKLGPLEQSPGAENVESISDASQVITQAISVQSKPSNSMNRANAAAELDDSDDDEIPTIDTTLTSDEDEDEEDTEMI